jgi:hypothetical protein
MSVFFQPTIDRSPRRLKGKIPRSPVASIYEPTHRGGECPNPFLASKAHSNRVFNAPMYHCHTPIFRNLLPNGPIMQDQSDGRYWPIASFAAAHQFGGSQG